ncbi:MAG: hypothetical protein IJO91_06895, partial [Oscillospiraceae bacterium]|nr:hypothetical protein [Oscillospiraceae bacterium]
YPQRVQRICGKDQPRSFRGAYPRHQETVIYINMWIKEELWKIINILSHRPFILYQQERRVEVLYEKSIL